MAAILESLYSNGVEYAIPKGEVENVKFSDIELFLIENREDIYEIDLNSNIFTDQKTNYVFTINEETSKQYRTTGDYTAIGTRLLYLKKGTKIITNADTMLERYAGTTYYGKGVLFTNVVNNGATSDLYFGFGRDAFDGAWQEFEVPESAFYTFSYFNSTEYETKLYVYQPMSLTVPKNFERIQPMIYDGYMSTTPCEYSLVNSKTYYQTVNGGTGTYQNKVTEPIVLSGYKGYSLLVYSPFGDLANTESTSGMGAIVYNSDDTEVKNLIVQCDFYSKDYYTIPLSDEELHVRIGFSAEASSPLLQFAIVPNEWLFANHLVPSKALYGKKILAFGDSYVNGHTMNYYHVWYALLARKNYGYYYQCGHNGAGLCRSSAVASLLTLISELDTEADIYFMVCGRNDSSMNVPIGEPSDTFNPETDMENSSTTNTTASFMGGLNYMYNYVIEKHQNAKFVAVTPWSFTPLESVTSGLDSYDYIEAIKRISQKWSIPCYNASQDSGIHVQSEAFRTLYFLSSTDQSHLNEEGHKLMYENSLPWIEAHL